MLDFGTDTPKLRLILSGFRGQLAPFITVHSPDSTKSGRCPYLVAKFAGTPRVFLFSAATVLRSVNVNNMAASSMYDDCNYTIMWEASPEELLEISRENPLTPKLRGAIHASAFMS